MRVEQRAVQVFVCESCNKEWRDRAVIQICPHCDADFCTNCAAEKADPLIWVLSNTGVCPKCKKEVTLNIVRSARFLD